jgi:DnaJ like chaperone protein
MQWFGKAIGAFIGFAAAGPVGSLLGAVLGHQVDQTSSVWRRREGRRAAAPEAISQLFFEVAFEVMGHVAKVDGRVSEDEIRIARRIMHDMRLSGDQVRIAIERFTAGKQAEYPLAARLAALDAQIGDRADLALAFVQLQLQAAVGAGQIDSHKRQLLWRVASALQVGRAEVAQVEALVRAHYQRHAAAATGAASVEDAYRVLGIASDASTDDVKRAYRRLMNQHHPDKLVARGLPESMASVAEQKTLEVRAAYERIKAARGFK